MPAKIKFNIGDKFNRLTTIEEVESEIQYNKNKITPLRKVKCVCDCGKEVIVRLTSLKSGYTKSCGCLKDEVFFEKNMIDRSVHNLRWHPLYNTWASMKGRCYNKKDNAFINYGGRGIEVCEEWREDFKCFYDWAINNGYSKDLTLDRKNNNGNYEPSNCRWATKKEQSNNRRSNILININGEIMTLMQACMANSLSYVNTRYALIKGKNFDEILLNVNK